MLIVLAVIGFATKCAGQTLSGGRIENATAGENIVAPAFCYVSAADGKIYKASAATTSNPATCLVFASATANNPCQVSFGTFTITDWASALLMGQVAYLSATTAGAITITPPTNKQVIGVQTQTSSFWVQIGAFENSVSGSGTSTLNYAAKTAAYAVVATDHTINCTSGTFTVMLPAVASVTTGSIYVIKNSGSGEITLDGNASELIDGDATAVILPQNAVSVQNTGAGWIIF